MQLTASAADSTSLSDESGMASPSTVLSALTAAAMALSPLASYAEEAPDAAVVEFKYLDYLDANHGADRMHVTSPVLYVQSPLGKHDAIEGAVTMDTMSGASPFFLNSLSGASGIGVHDQRTAGDLTYRHYFERTVLSVGGALSTEDDYKSRSGNVEMRWSTEDQNTTLAVGASRSNDNVGSNIDPTLNAPRQSTRYLFGVTRVLTPESIVQSNFSYTAGHGDFSNPYEVLDLRPDGRHEFAWLTRYRYFFSDADAALHADLRYFHDNWGVEAGNLDLAWYQALKGGWTVTPNLRFYTQHAARFFSTVFPPPVFGGIYATDYRLGSFGAITIGLRASKALSEDTRLDFSANHYEQRAAWHMGGNGSSGMSPFLARWFSIGLTHNFR